MRVLFISRVWPDPRHSAACVRSLALARSAADKGYDVTFMSSSKWNQDAISASRACPEISFVHSPVNNVDAFKGATENVPDVVVFDTHVVEEQFSWKVRQEYPKALLVLDTQDLHSVREIRRSMLIEGQLVNQDSLSLELGSLPDSIYSSCRTLLMREISSILRCDLSLLVSPTEVKFLVEQCRVPESSLTLSSFFYNATSLPKKTFSERKHYVSIGSWRHLPNYDSFEFLSRVLWPKLRQRSEHGVELHIYGSRFPSSSPFPLPEGMVLKGFYKGDITKALQKYRVMLAPLRFGAGIKGKVSDSWASGTPVATTPFGMEGMHSVDEDQSTWKGGLCGSSVEEFIDNSHELYSNEHLWSKKQVSSKELLDTLFNGQNNLDSTWKSVEDAVINVDSTRRKNLVQQILWWSPNTSYEYFSKMLTLRADTKNRISKGDWLQQN